MKPIWYFVGLILTIMGGIILISGIYNLLYPPESKIVLAEKHPDIWWGAIMLIAGIIYILRNRKITIE